MRILQEIRRVEWRETAGELGALLLEARPHHRSHEQHGEGRSRLLGALGGQMIAQLRELT